jgi:acetylornithine deacetylase
MPELDPVTRLTADLVAIDSRSFLSNIPVADRLEQELAGFEIERVDYVDEAGVAKRCLVAHRGPKGGLALSGHMDTVPATGWTDDPWDPRIDAQEMLHGLGSADMKGPVAACIIAARSMPADTPVTLLLTADEETSKAGARAIAQRSALARSLGLTGIVIAEPTGLVPVRGHRSHIGFTAVAKGVQAHSSLGIGKNANWDLLPFLAEMRRIYDLLHDDPAWHDTGYSPVFSDFNLVLDNHGTAVNVTVATATARIKYRYSASIDPAPIVRMVQEAADRAGLTLTIDREGKPPEIPSNHPLIRQACAVTGKAAITVPFGTDASELQELAPCVILGPDTTQTAHTPHELVSLAQLREAVGVFQKMLAG